jgi:hypothetical protein
MNGRRVLKFLAIVWSIAAGFLALGALFVRISDFSLGHVAPAELALAKQSTEGAAHCRDVVKGIAPVESREAGAASHYRAWMLGYQFGIANSGARNALETAWALARELRVPEMEVPKGHVAYAANDFAVSLEEDPQCVSAALARRYSVQHAGLYKFGAAVGMTAGSGGILTQEPQIRVYGRAAGVPQELWQPLLGKKAIMKDVVSRIDGYIRRLD